jgi:hypothetical protein
MGSKFKVDSQVERLRALGGPLSADLDALNPAMLHEIFGSRERAA